MRSTEEIVAAVHQRSGELEKASRQRRVRIMQTASITAALLIVTGMAFMIPQIDNTALPPDVMESMRASVFSDTGALGMIVIGLISFLLGISVTVFCFRLKKWKDEADSEPPSDKPQDEQT